MAILSITVDTDDGLSQDFIPLDSVPFITEVDVKESNGNVIPFVMPQNNQPPQ